MSCNAELNTSHIPIVSSSQKTPAQVLLAKAPYGKEEIFVYDLFIKGELKTEIRYVLSMIEEEGQTVYTLLSLLGRSGVFDSKVTFKTDTYEPTYSKKVLHLAGGKIEASVVYRRQQANVHLLLPQQECFTLDFKGVVYDNEQIIHILRTIDYEQRSGSSFRYVYPFAKHIQTALFRLLRIENVTVKAGAFVCFAVELIIPGQRILLWYAKDCPHQMVRYQSDAQEMVLELRECGKKHHLD